MPLEECLVGGPGLPVKVVEVTGSARGPGDDRENQAEHGHRQSGQADVFPSAGYRPVSLYTV